MSRDDTAAAAGAAARVVVPPPPEEVSMDGAFRLMKSLMSLSREALKHSVETRHLVLEQVRGYVARLGVDLERLSVVHLAGTKGKGSTCAFVESVLRAHGYRTGLFSSPHLVHLRERFRVDGRPVPEPLFLRHLYGTYEDLRATAHLAPDGHPPMPSYFRFLTLVGFRIFAEAGVDVVVLETGLGGRLDATNCVPRPVACGITLIDYDHVNVLGDTLDMIAREKGGILKPGAACFSVVQDPEAAAALAECAAEAGVELPVVPPLPGHGVPPLGLEGEHQYQNAALAVRLAHAWLRHAGCDGVPERLEPGAALPPRFLGGLASCRWPGRCQRVASPAVPGLTWHLDGAHTPESMVRCVDWFRGASPGGQERHRVLLFNCGHERNPFPLVRPLAASGLFHTVLLCPFDFDRPHLSGPPGLRRLVEEHDPSADLDALPADCDSWQGTLLQVWRREGGEGGTVMPSTAKVVAAVEDLARARTGGRVDVLVTGSLYTVGNTLALVDPDFA